MEEPIGLDLGTMSARVAGLSAAGAARILPDRQGRRSTPSTVAFDGRSALIGSLRPGAVRHVAAAAGDPTWRFPVAGMSLRVEEVAALILGRPARRCRPTGSRCSGRSPRASAGWFWR